MEIVLTIISGLIAGFILATPPGVINLTMFNYLIQKRYRDTVWVGAGSATLDIFYAALAFFSTSAIYSSLQDFIHSNPITIYCLEIIFILALVVFGWAKFTGSLENDTLSKIKNLKTNKKLLHPYLLGCLLAVTHIFVPTFLPFYVYMAAVLIDSKLVVLSPVHFWIFSVMFALGNLIWVLMIVCFFRYQENRFGEKQLDKINKGIGMLFMFVGVIMAWRLIE